MQITDYNKLSLENHYLNNKNIGGVAMKVDVAIQLGEKRVLPTVIQRE